MLSLESFIRRVPKVELHVHLEGSIFPGTLLLLARRNKINLPVRTFKDFRKWYRFRSFEHFIRVYLQVCRCLRTVDDLEFIARRFLLEQSKQNIRYSEVTYTAFTHYRFKGWSFRDQLAALQRARCWAEKELKVSVGWIIDIVRSTTPEDGMMVAKWAVSGMDQGVVALGLGGFEAGHPPEKFEAAFRLARKEGLAVVPHAGETAGAKSIWGALRVLKATRIGHGVRCLEDPKLVQELKKRQIPLEICPTSNIELNIFKKMSQFPFRSLLKKGLFLTINSYDPALFQTSLTNEYLKLLKTFNLKRNEIIQLVFNSVDATLLSPPAKRALVAIYKQEIERLLLLN